MRSGKVLWLATENRNKLREAQAILTNFGIRARWLKRAKVEIQSSDLEKISSFAANNISRTHKGMVVVEDSGLFVEALGGFPGPFSAYVQRTIGPSGILRLLGQKEKRGAYFQASIAASESGCARGVFTGTVRGRISRTERGDNGFGFDPIFIPEGRRMTFGEMGDSQKNSQSHRSKVYRKLADWYLSS